jgi:hypothetical protein
VRGYRTWGAGQDIRGVGANDPDPETPEEEEEEEEKEEEEEEANGMKPS